MNDDYFDTILAMEQRRELSHEWVSVFGKVPRRLFVPDTVWVGDEVEGFERTDRREDPERWANLVDADTPLVTQLSPDGAPTSSSSMPLVVAEMFNHLDVIPGQRALNLGTGTGWTAGLLAQYLGSDNVVTVEVDQDVARQADDLLKAARLHPLSVVGDAAAGYPQGAPFQRTLATFAVRDVPFVWVQQTDGVIVTPWGNGMSNNALLRLESDGRVAVGPVVDTASFMWMRAQTPRPRIYGEDGAVTDLDMDPREVFADSDRLFAIGLRVPGCRYSVGWGEGDQAQECTLWLSDGAGSWARAEYAPGATPWAVQAGPRQLWDEVRAAFEWWQHMGSPRLKQFGLTVTADGQSAWVGDPGNLI
ncbi:hypothetical protein ACEZCY_32525 [Streptacidiphilus sp. N1-12]|uniref:Uncharacterized protein n=2 Tax=Streptacidiphilus alkalitolerans TaxID=3342712 RepID=A0ABV6WPL1_9ACTN